MRERRPWCAETPFSGRPRHGFTLIELLVVMTILGVIAAIALPSFRGVRERALVTAAIAEISSIQQEITEFHLLNGRLPAGLAEVGRGADLDPWGRPYRYLDHAGATTGQKRKDRFLVPVNSDYDLYSAGADGATQPPFPPMPSRDDVVRANNGGFVGLAASF
jgi:general secretion pathway protein G